jgi:hypothetical protein
MALDKILHKIKTQISDLTGTMEAFVDETVQPSAEDCEKLRRQMNDLLECLAVYKHFKHDKEISPSFHIHAKISEMSPTDGNSMHEQARDIVKSQAEEEEEEDQYIEKPKAQPSKPLLIGINDKFRFINELFGQNNSEYNIVMEQINNLNNWQETEIYLHSLKNVYGWQDNSEVVKFFYSLVKNRFH